MGVYPCPYCGGMVTRELTCLPPFLMAQTPGGLPRFLECRACELRERQRAFRLVTLRLPKTSPISRLGNALEQPIWTARRERLASG